MSQRGMMLVVWIGIALLVMIVAGMGWLGYTYFFPRSLKLAEEAISAGDWRTAQELLEKHVQRYPFDTRARMLLARAYRRDIPDDLHAAETHLWVALQRSQTFPGIELEEMLLRCQRGGGSREVLAFVSGVLPSAPPAEKQMILEALARGQLRAGRLHAAVRWLDRWIAELPEDLSARRWRAAILQYQQRPQLALDDYQVLRTARPNDAQVTQQFGCLLAETGYDYRQALELLGTLPSTSPQVQTSVAICHYGLGNLDEVEALLNEALTQDERFLPAWIWKSRLLLDQGHADQAAAVAQFAIQLLPGIRSGEQKKRLLACQPPRLGPPAAYFEKLLHLQIQAYQRAGQTQNAQTAIDALQQVQTALAEWNRLIESAGQVPNLDELYRAAELQLTLRDCDEAEQLLRQILQVSPEYPGAAALLQQCLDLRYQSLQMKHNKDQWLHGQE